MCELHCHVHAYQLLLRCLYRGARQLPKFPLRSLLLGICCEALQYKMGPAPVDRFSNSVIKAPAAAPAPPAKPPASTSSSSKDPAPVADTSDLAIPSKDTLTQSQKKHEIKLGSSHDPVNQLHKAARMYADAGNFHKQHIISSALVPLAKWHSDQSTKLRSLEATIPWDE